MEANKPFHPARHTKYSLVTSILDGTYPPGSNLPNERLFAEQIGVTRQTLRETLQRLAAEGWVTIRHGKSTMVNDYWKEGGLGLLSSLVNMENLFPMDLSRTFLKSGSPCFLLSLVLPSPTHQRSSGHISISQGISGARRRPSRTMTGDYRYYSSGIPETRYIP